MASALLFGLILVCIGLTSGVVTEFQCTDGSVCANDRVECNCMTSTGVIDWTISYRVMGSSNQSWIPVTEVNLNRFHISTEEYGYNFTYNQSDNSSRLTFNLNASESIFVVCKNGDVNDSENTTILDLGYYAKAPTNLTTTFNASGVILQWEDTGNNCSTVYNMTIYDGTLTSVLTNCTNETTLLINSSELNITETYTYTIKGWNEQQSNNSKPFTLAPVEVMSIIINTSNTTDPCKNSSCCANVTLNIILESLDPYVKHPDQYYNISYNSNTGNIPVTYVPEYGETEWNGSELNYNEIYCFTVIPMNYFSTGMSINNDTTTEYPCQPPGNGGNNGGGNNGGDNKGWIAGPIIGVVLIAIIGIAIIIIVICRVGYNREG